jgi:hypothetical protein
MRSSDQHPEGQRQRAVICPTIGVLLGFGVLLNFAAGSTAQDETGRVIPDETHIVAVGAYSNVRHTEERPYGFTLMLWRAGKCLVGFIESSEGLAGDTPIGELQNVRYEASTGRLSFSAKLTLGEVSLSGPARFEPSRGVVVFKGVIGTTRVEGEVTHSRQDLANAAPTRRIVTRTSAARDEFTRGPATYGAWRAAWKPTLRARGPSW